MLGILNFLGSKAGKIVTGAVIGAATVGCSIGEIFVVKKNMKELQEAIKENVIPPSIVQDIALTTSEAVTASFNDKNYEKRLERIEYLKKKGYLPPDWQG